MNRRIAAFAIATVAVLGLTACSGSPSSSEGEGDKDEASTSAPAEETSTDQSVADACGIVIPELQEASSALSGIDPTSTDDPQATVDQFNSFVTSLGETAGKIDNAEVKAATTAVHEDFVALGDVLSKVLIDQDTAAASDLTTITTEMTESATALQELCTA
jgi:hypothetical protein